MPHHELTADLPLGRYLAILTKMYYGALSNKLQHTELEKHYSVLLLLDNADKKYTQQAVADVLKIDKASMVGMVDYLSKKGYLIRVSNPADRREHWLELTTKAIKTIPEIRKQITELNKLAMHGLSKDDAAAFNNSLCTIFENLNKLPADRVIINYKKVKKT